MLRILLMIVLFAVPSAKPALAGVASGLMKAAAKKLTGEAVKKTTKHLAVQAAAKAVKESVEAAAERTATTAVRYFGKAAAQAPRFVDNFATAAGKMSARSQRRLLIMAPALQKSGQAASVVSRLAKGNADDLITTLWKHKEKLGAAAVVTALVVHGDDVAKTAVQVVEAGGQYVAKPLIDGSMEHVVQPVSRLFVSAIVLTMVLGVVCGGAYLFGDETRERVEGFGRTIASLLRR